MTWEGLFQEKVAQFVTHRAIFIVAEEKVRRSRTTISGREAVRLAEWSAHG